MIEFLKCADSLTYFMSSYFTLPDGSPYAVTPSIKVMLDSFSLPSNSCIAIDDDFDYISFAAGCALWEAIFYSDTNRSIGIAVADYGDYVRVMATLLHAYRKLPDSLLAYKDRFTKTSYMLSFGESRIFIGYVGCGYLFGELAINNLIIADISSKCEDFLHEVMPCIRPNNGTCNWIGCPSFGDSLFNDCWQNGYENKNNFKSVCVMEGGTEDNMENFIWLKMKGI